MKRVYNDTFDLHHIDKSKNVPSERENLKKDVVSADDALIKIIYASDPRTGLPSGDLAVFMSENTSPEVRDYIQKNLMRPTGEKPVDTGLSVDEMHALSRHAGESRDSYISRMNDYFSNLREANLASKTKSE